MSKFINLFIKHYSDTTYKRSESQIERERFLFGKVPFHRMLMIIAAVLIQLCVGSLYAWSIYNAPIDSFAKFSTGSSLVTFYIASGCFGFSAALFGPWLERNGPKKSAILGSILFYFGNLLAACAVQYSQRWLLYVGFGLIGGCGLGISYISPISSLQKWFPKNRGVASGLAVCGFGGGSIIASLAQNYFIGLVNVPLTFVILGSIYFCIMLSCALILRIPPPDFAMMKEEKSGVQPVTIPLLVAINSLEYRLMYFMFLSNSLAGLVILGKLASMVTDIFGLTPFEAAIVVSVNSAFNLTGRFLFSTLSDKIGRKVCFLVSLFCQAILLGLMIHFMSVLMYWPFILCVWLLSSLYGAGLGIIPAFLSDMFGSSNVGSCHGIILTAFSIAGIAGGLAFSTILKQQEILLGAHHPFLYILNFAWICAFASCGFFVTVFIDSTSMKNRLSYNSRELKILGIKIYSKHQKSGDLKMSSI